ncbi:Na+/H+ antiporter subunit D [Aureimonas frigidaquae]|uniref:Na+/H+ antiporter subunit D n=1 Tax=Aureimonas frigidaquae TaxID=424757 RepID=UPI000AFEF600|nr:Na+/H+ antiporter subunit D [Aureimonas frigidaquae]
MISGFVFGNAILWPVLIPLAAAAATAILWNRPALQRIVSRSAAAGLCAAGLLLLWQVLDRGVVAVQFGAWAAPFGISFVADRLAAAMVAITGIMALSTMIFGMADIRRREERAGFHPLLQGMLAGVNGAFLTGDIFNLYVWFEIMLITAMGLIAIGRTRAQLDGVLRYAVLNLFSTLLFLMAVGMLYGVAGSLNMADLALRLRGETPSFTLAVSGILLFCGFGIKAGYFPLFFWLPASYHTASITVAAIFAGLLTKVGVYACFRVFTLILPMEVSGLGPAMAVVAAGTMIFGVFGAAVQWDVRRILSFHIVSQIGYMLLGLALATPAALAGGIFYIVHHIIVKANLFLVAGAMHRASGSFDLRRSGGLMRSHPALAALFLVPALSLGGIPPLSGFWAKFLVLDASLRAQAYALAGAALATGLLTLYSMSKIWSEGFWKPAPAFRRRVRTVPAPFYAAIALLAALTVCMGLFAEPFVTFAHAAARDLADPTPYIEAVLRMRLGR